MLTPKQIRGRLLDQAGLTVKDVAEQVGVNPTTVSVVIHRHGTSKPIERYIAKALGLPFKEVWGNNNNHTTNRKAA